MKELSPTLVPGFKQEATGQMFNMPFRCFIDNAGTRVLAPPEGLELLREDPNLYELLERTCSYVSATGSYKAAAEDVRPRTAQPVLALKSAATPADGPGLRQPFSVYYDYTAPGIVKAFDHPRHPTEALIQFAAMSALRHFLVPDRDGNIPSLTVPTQIAFIQAAAKPGQAPHQSILMEYIDREPLPNIRHFLDQEPADQFQDEVKLRIAPLRNSEIPKTLQPFVRTILAKNIMLPRETIVSGRAEDLSEFTLIGQPIAGLRTRVSARLAGIRSLQKLLKDTRG